MRSRTHLLTPIEIHDCSSEPFKRSGILSLLDNLRCCLCLLCRGLAPGGGLASELLDRVLDTLIGRRKPPQTRQGYDDI